MHNKIKNTIERSLNLAIRDLDSTYSLSKISALLSKNIKSFVTRPGKRVRPMLFVLAYLGFAKKTARQFYKTAASFELLHDFLLVHDDIIDKSATRRGKPSMHKMFDRYLKRFKNIKFNGQDLAIVTGDVIYALAIDAFLAIKEDMQRKLKALRRFIQAVIYTATGEFIELLSGTKGIEKISKEDIYRIYDYKTAYYTFAVPLSCGAILAGASRKQVNRLHRYGIYLGRAFQINDDILGMFSEKKEMGKSALTDLQEAKKTILIFYAYNKSNKKDKLIIKRILAKDKVKRADLLMMRKIISTSGALNYARKEILRLLQKANSKILSCPLRPKYKQMLCRYSQKLLSL